MGLAGLSVAMLGASANAEIESEFTVGYHSDYVFRGELFGNNMFDFAFDFGGSCDCGLDWNAGVWFGQWSEETVSDFQDELDIYGGVSKDLGFGALELGFIRYSAIGDSDSSNTEIYLGATTSFNVIDLGATFFWNIDSDSGSSVGTGDWYLKLDASYGFDITESLSGEIGLGLAFFDTDSADGLAHYSAYLALTQALSEDISISPYIEIISNDEDYDAAESDFLVGGVRTTFSF